MLLQILGGRFSEGRLTYHGSKMVNLIRSAVFAAENSIDEDKEHLGF